jgi:hypothetical protein
MEEQEVIKQKKKKFKIWSSKEHTIWQKLKEFAVETFIIVFAVSLSIWFDNWNSHRNEQIQVKTFLLGLKTDIQEDIAEVNDLISMYKTFSRNYQYLSNVSVANTYKNDTLTAALSSIYSNAYLRPNMSRYTGFLMSGKLLNIENEKLTQNILNFYQELIPRIKSSENGYIERHSKFSTYLLDNMTEVISDQSLLKVLLTIKAKNYSKRLTHPDQLLERYNDFIKAGNEIIKSIDEEYLDEKN